MISKKFRRRSGSISQKGPHGDQIATEQVRQLYALAPIGFLATIINSIILYFVMRAAMEPLWLNTWIGGLAAVLILRMGLTAWFWSAGLRPETISIWKIGFILGLAATGIAWGSIGIIPLSGTSLAHQVFIAFVLGGMAAGASSTFSIVRAAFPAFAIPALVPLAVQFFLIGDQFHLAMGGMICLYLVLLWRIAEHNRGVSLSSLLLRFENREMIEKLKKAKAEVEELNTKLLAEIEHKEQAEAELRASHEDLEKLVKERTADLVSANKQLVAAKEAAETASLAKSEFLANMSHEMRTPLAGTLGMVRLVLEMEIGEEERQLLEMADRSAESLLRIIGDVLDFSRLEAGMMTFEEEPVSIPAVIKSSMEVLLLTAREKGLDVKWRVCDSVPPQVRTDQGRLRQVLVNLLGNAVKFTDRGKIAVFVRRLDNGEPPGDDFLLFSVRDTGHGIPADQKNRIFEMFTQADSSLTRKYGGTGLGLALTRKIVENLGGRIWVESIVGVGSTFHFTLPLK